LSVNEIAALYSSSSSSMKSPAVRVSAARKGKVAFSLSLDDDSWLTLDGVDVVSLLLNGLFSLNDSTGHRPIVRYTIPRSYENLLDYDLEATCGNFLESYRISLPLDDRRFDPIRLKELLLSDSESLDKSDSENDCEAEEHPHMEFVYYGSMDNDASYDIVGQKSSHMDSNAEVVVEAFVLNNQLTLTLLCDKDWISTEEKEEKMKEELKKGLMQLKDRKPSNAISFNGLEISEENLNELILK